MDDSQILGFGPITASVLDALAVATYAPEAVDDRDDGRRRRAASAPGDPRGSPAGSACSAGSASRCSSSLVFAAGHGQLDVPPSEVLGSLMHRLGLDIGPMPHHPQGENTLWQVRFPRVVMAALAGAASPPPAR